MPRLTQLTHFFAVSLYSLTCAMIHIGTTMQPPIINATCIIFSWETKTWEHENRSVKQKVAKCNIRKTCSVDQWRAETYWNSPDTTFALLADHCDESCVVPNEEMALQVATLCSSASWFLDLENKSELWQTHGHLGLSQLKGSQG